jgi:biotin operon repressor
MAKIRKSSEDYRKFILSNIEKYSTEIAKIIAEKFSISRQAANKHLQKLVEENILAVQGNTRSRIYKLAPIVSFDKQYLLNSDLKEDVVWSQDIKQLLGEMPDNVINLWHYCFTEMFNNVIDHSDASIVNVRVNKSAVSTQIEIIDDGVGIFKKIQERLLLTDERHAVLELAKGKFTTDPANHSGEGIFFSSRACDHYAIFSGGVYFSHKFGKKEDWILEAGKTLQGTAVIMRLNNHTSRKLKNIFDEYTSGDSYGFNKTVVPVILAQYGDDSLISRSQAKRVLNRVDRFKIVIFDFEGVDSIGQAFADEVFRVFANQYPNIKLVELHANQEVRNMISRAREYSFNKAQQDQGL